MLGSQSFFDRREVRDLVSYLKWIDNPDDEVSFLRVANVPARGLGGKTMQTLVAAAVKKGVPVWRVMTDPDSTAGLPPAARRGIAGLIQLHDDVRDRITRDSIGEAYQTLVQRIDYGTEIAKNYEKPEEREARMASLGEVGNAIGAFEDNADGKPELSGFLGEIALGRPRDG